MRLDELKKIIVSPAESLKSVMKLLSYTKTRLVFVVDNEDNLIGSVSDGDVRRAIINGNEFETPVSEVMFKSPRFVRRSERKFEEKAKQYIVEEALYSIPVLDEKNRVVDILSWYDFFDTHPHEQYIHEVITNPVVIMAGGKGSRLDPFTKILPKPLIPFGDKPIVERIMDNFHKYGFTNFILVLNYKKDIIRMYFSENRSPYQVDCVDEQKYLGTAGGLELLKNKIKESFYVCNCDTLLESNLKNILLWHKGAKSFMTIIGCHKEMTFPYGSLKVDKGYLKEMVEKPKYDLIINTGVYILEPDVFSFISEGEVLDMNRLIERTMTKGKVTVYPLTDGWFDVGQWKEYKESLYLLENNGKIEVNEDTREQS